MTPKEVLEFASKNGARQLDLRFTDLPGLQQHVSYPISELTESSFEEGFGFDGSSIRGWAAINESGGDSSFAISVAISAGAEVLRFTTRVCPVTVTPLASRRCFSIEGKVRFGPKLSVAGPGFGVGSFRFSARNRLPGRIDRGADRQAARRQGGGEIGQVMVLQHARNDIGQLIEALPRSRDGGPRVQRPLQRHFFNARIENGCVEGDRPCGADAD